MYLILYIFNALTNRAKNILNIRQISNVSICNQLCVMTYIAIYKFKNKKTQEMHNKFRQLHQLIYQIIVFYQHYVRLYQYREDT